MRAAWDVAIVSGLIPLARAWIHNGHTTLRHALAWALAAWACWALVIGLGEGAPGAEGGFLPYLALCLTTCAGVAVLGARRPGVGAWNFVVGGLLLVLLRPLAEGWGELRLSAAHLTFLGGALAVGLLNYLPTRLAAGTLLLAAGCALYLARLGGAPLSAVPSWASIGCVALAPWAAWARLGLGRRDSSEADALWLAYRDRLGFVWGQRVRDQLNRAAANAGWSLRLTWSGFRPGTEPGTMPDAEQVRALLRAVLKRFGQESATSAGAADS